MSRRGFLAGLFAAPVAPVIVADPGKCGIAMAKLMNPRGGRIVQRTRPQWYIGEYSSEVIYMPKSPMIPR